MTDTIKLGETIAKLQGVKVEFQPILTSIIVLAYDIPVTEEGKKARTQWFKVQRRVGAKMLNRSVYIMPNSQQAISACIEIAKTFGTNVEIFYDVNPRDNAERYTALYDAQIEKDVVTLEERIEAEGKLIEEQHFGMADRMHRKSTDLLLELYNEMIMRGSSPDIQRRACAIKNKLVGEQKNAGKEVVKA